MSLRSFALVLVLVVAATPAISLVCEMDCNEPPAAKSPCHDSNVPNGGTTLRDASHVCDHDHSGVRPALLTSVTHRDSLGASFAGPLPLLAHALVRDAGMATAAAMHGPPGLSGRSTSSHIAILRI